MEQSHDDDYEDRYYSSGRDSDDSPILSYRYDTRRCARSPSPESRGRRATVTVAKFFLFCMAMIMFCVLLYIPVYNKANDQMSKGSLAGWSIHTNRDTKIYVQPKNVTTIHEPKHICPPETRHKKNDLLLLIIVCSSTTHFDRRVAIRETWGHYKTYLELSKVYNEVREKYKNYNYTYDLYPDVDNHVYNSSNSERVRREVSSFKHLLPELAKALQIDLNNDKTEVREEKRFPDDVMLPEFDMNKEIGEGDTDYNYDYETNVMKIPPKGEEDSPDVDKVLNMLRNDNELKKEIEDAKLEKMVEKPDFKVLFLLGMPGNDNDTEVQSKIEEEVQKYGDVLQEGFVDSYYNLTLKSIMMLKWVTNKCDESVRYILKTDDDMYINVPALVMNLRNRSRVHDTLHPSAKEYMLIGDLICGARPVADAHSKWFSPRYMYAGRVYPRYVSGTGYALSAPAAAALYRAALNHDYFHLEDIFITGSVRATCTLPAALNHDYFHLEDIFITGMCALRATPRISPRDDPQFSYVTAPARPACAAHSHVTAHRVAPKVLRATVRRLKDPAVVDQCERIRLTQVRRDRIRIQKQRAKAKLAKVAPSML